MSNMTDQTSCSSRSKWLICLHCLVVLFVAHTLSACAGQAVALAPTQVPVADAAVSSTDTPNAPTEATIDTLELPTTVPTETPILIAPDQKPITSDQLIEVEIVTAGGPMKVQTDEDSLCRLGHRMSLFRGGDPGNVPEDQRFWITVYGDNMTTDLLILRASSILALRFSSKSIEHITSSGRAQDCGFA